MLKKLIRGQGGFTLIELLVTVAIMGVLFGIVTIALNGLTEPSEANARSAELDAVQTAVDVYLAANYPTVTTITERASTDAATIGTADVDCDFCSYLRGLPTEYIYYWSTDGDVAQQP